MLLTLLKNIHQQCYRMPLIRGPSDVFSWLDRLYIIVKNNTYIRLYPSWYFTSRDSWRLYVLFLAIFTWITWLRWCLLGFSTVKLSFFPLQLINTLGDTWGYANLFLLKPFPKISLILVFIRGFLSVTIMTEVTA